MKNATVLEPALATLPIFLLQCKRLPFYLPYHTDASLSPPRCCFLLPPRVNTVKYNRFHDQLLLSGSSDCMVHLWRVSSVSSAPLLEPEDDDLEHLELNGGGGGLGGANGSKGEAADIRVSAALVWRF